MQCMVNEVWWICTKTSAVWWECMQSVMHLTTFILNKRLLKINSQINWKSDFQNHFIFATSHYICVPSADSTSIKAFLSKWPNCWCIYRECNRTNLWTLQKNAPYSSKFKKMSFSPTFSIKLIHSLSLSNGQIIAMSR